MVDWIQFHVPGRICMTPRASELDTSALLKPLSCHATAAASDPGTPWAAAIWPTSPALTRSGVGMGAEPDDTVLVVVVDVELTGVVDAVAGAPALSRITRPAHSGDSGSSPFRAARLETDVPYSEAIPVSVSP